MPSPRAARQQILCTLLFPPLMLSLLESTTLRHSLQSASSSTWASGSASRLASRTRLASFPSTVSCTRWASRYSGRPSAQDAESAPPDNAPRYIRRQALQKGGKKASPGEYTGRKKLLDPYVLGKRLRALCDEGKVDDAVEMLKNAPRDAMNVVVWNTMIWECLKVKRFQLAYKLYVEMKRRGFSPSTRTFQTMFTGLSKIESWSTHAQQLSNARLLYDAFQRHITSLKKHEPDSADITPIPLAAYIKILGDNGQYQETLDVFRTLDPSGPFAPDATIFTAMFQATSTMRRSLTQQGIVPPEQWSKQVAADARELWMKLPDVTEGAPGIVDVFVATSAISALSKGRKKETDLAFDIVEKYFGLSRNPSHTGFGHFKLTSAALGAILKLCNAAEEYSTCLDFFQKVKERPASHGGLSILDRPHMEEVLKARYHISSKDLGQSSLQDLKWMSRQEHSAIGVQIRPATSTYNLVLSACWKSNDWPSAVATFELMTGYSAADFQHTPSDPDFVPQRRSGGPNLVPSAEALSMLIRTALATRQLRYIQQAFRILDHVGLDHIKVPPASRNPKKDSKNNVFYGAKLYTATAEALKLLDAHQGETRRVEISKWHALVARYKAAFARPSVGYKPTNLTGESPRPKARTRL